MAEGHGGGVLRELLAVFGFGVDTSELKKGENHLEEFFGKLKTIGVGIAGAFAIHEIAEFAEANVKAMTEIERTASALGVSTEKVQEFQFASKSLGMESEQLLNMMGRLQVVQQAAATGSKQAGAAFGALGVHVKNSRGEFKSADELFLDVADGISKTKDASKAAALATQLFGRQGRQLLPFLKEGRKGVEELSEEFKELGGGYSEQAIAESKKYEKQSAKLEFALRSVKNTILGALLPVLTAIVQGVTAAVKWFHELSKNSNLVQAALLTLGAAATAFAVQMAIAFAPVLLIAAAIGALILLVDDFITMMKGGDSVLGEWIDKIFGKGAHVEVVQTIKDLWEGIGRVIQTSVAWLKEHVDLIKKIVGYLPAVALIRSGAKFGDFLGDAAGKLKAKLVGETEYPPNVRGYGAPSYLGLGSPKASLPLNGPEFEPPPALTPSGAGMGPTTINMTIQAAPGMNEQQLGEHASKLVDQKLKQRNRETFATFQRAGGT